MSTDTKLEVGHGCTAGSCTCHPKRGADPVAMIVAILISGVLGFAAYAKWQGPDPHEKVPGTELLLDHVVATVEVAVILGVLALHRWKFAWLTLAVMFGGFAGYAAFYTILGRSCGCFGNLWKPPLGLTLAIDGVFSFVALGMAKRRGAGWPLIITTLIVALGAGAAGYTYANSKPRQETVAAKYENKDGPQRLLETELLADVRALPPGAPAYYIFVYDPECHVCEDMMPMVDFQAEGLESSADPVLQVRKYSVNDLEAKYGIERWAFAPTPFVVLIKDGQVVRDLMWNEKPFPIFGEGSPFPDDVKSLLDASH